MTVLTDARSVIHPTDGVQTEFAFSYQFDRDTDLNAIETDRRRARHTQTAPATDTSPTMRDTVCNMLQIREW